MNPKSTKWFVVLALALFAYIFFFERHTRDTTARQQAAGRLLPDFDPATVSSLEILSGNQVLRVQRTNETWTLTVPVQYPVQSAAVEKFLTALGQLSRQTYITASELLAQPRGPAEFGLDNPLASVFIQQGAQRKELRVGGPTPFGNRVYLQLVGADGLFAADTAFLGTFPRSANDWRDTTFLNLPGLTFNRLEIRAGARGFEVQRNATNKLWELTKPMPARADNPKVEALLRTLQEPRISQFLTDDPAADLDAMGLRPPEAELVFGQGTNELLVLQLGRSPTNAPTQVHARRANQSSVVLVPKSLTDPLRTSFTDFRDRRLLSFAPIAADRIDVRAEESFTLQRQTNGLWRLLEPLNMPADAGLMKEFLATLGELEVVQFIKDVVTDFSSYGLAPPSRQITLSASVTNAAGPTNQVLVQLDFGTNQADRVFVRRADENSVYAVASSAVQRLPQIGFQLRDRRIWSFAATNVNSLTVKLRGQAHKLVRNEAQQWVLAPGSQGTVNIFAVDELLHRLGELSAEVWVGRGTDKLAEYGFAEAAHELVLEVVMGEKTESLTVAFGRASPTLRPYASVTLDGQPTLFEFPLMLYGIYREALRGVVPALTAPGR